MVVYASLVVTDMSKQKQNTCQIMIRWRSNNIKYEDANNLYGCSISEFLPHGEQYFVNEEFVNKFDFV